MLKLKFKNMVSTFKRVQRLAQNHSYNLWSQGREYTVYLVSGFPQPLRSGLDLPSVCAPDNTTISCKYSNLKVKI